MTNRMRIESAIITASGNGIGRATARGLASEGVRVAIVDRDPDAVAESVELIRADGGEAFGWTADCTDEREVDRVVGAVRARFAHIDALVNNVGGSAGHDIAAFHEQTAEVYARVVNQCLMATMLWSRAVVPGLQSAGYGKIVNIASDAAFVGDPHMAEYSAAKAGVLGLTRALARELAEHQINVNAVAPGPTRTAALGRLAPDVLERAAAEIPLKRLGEPEDIAKAVAFFASTDSDFVTGQTLIVGGGRWML